MKKIILFIILYINISCSSQLCGADEVIPNEPKYCHTIPADNKDYCCYFKGKNLDTNVDEKFCWAFAKTQIDDGKYKDTISDLEKGTDSHVTKKHSNVKLDCFSSYLKSYVLITLFLLF